jgi:two-component system CheB/CheR fusion protein
MSSAQNPDKSTSGGDSLPPESPDTVEELLAPDIDDIIPTRGYEMTPMVGIGGSAGSIQALTAFFHQMPADSGMVFVVILHLSPHHESTLAELLGDTTKMPVVQAVDGQKVDENHVYVIPPGKYLTTIDGHLRLTDLKNETGKRVAVDLFFRSLADSHGPHAAAVVLSGADGDGALGIKRIKERGGLTIAQDPEEAEHPGMPRTSIATGMVDWVLRVREIPQQLVDYQANEQRVKLPPEDGPQLFVTPPRVGQDDEAVLRDVLIFLRTRTGCDFSYYKRATIVRRIARRMQVNNVEDLHSYLRVLRTNAGEPTALLQDLLISVTNFFRDRDAFKALEQRIPDLFKGKGASDSVRVWTPACATGEEAYSIAMLLLEHASGLDAPPSLQVFACDLHDAAIRTARAGVYPEVIVADVSEDRLRRFFVKDHNGYQVRRELREMVLFATHDLLKDPPFSRMDLISCRNLLIYLNREAQERVLDTFHFALKPDGLLFLGTSESVDDSTPLFRILDKKNRIYVRKAASRQGLPIPQSSGSLLRVIRAHERAHHEPVVHGKQFAQEIQTPGPPVANLDRTALGELHFQLIESLAPPSVIVSREYDLLHVSEHAGRFLRVSGGEPSTNLLRLVDPALRIELRTALFRAGESGETVETRGIPLDIEGEPSLVDVRVTPVPGVDGGFLLVVFDKRSSTEVAPVDNEAAWDREPVVRQLERELEQVKGRHRDIVEQYEASTEELKASNEELQAMNEELRSASEELETSREELQSINEELTTVNAELKSKVEEVAHANADLQNLMASTFIATVFLDRDLAITRYTPTAIDLFHLIPGDIGRPLADLKNRLEYPELTADAVQVQKTLIPTEREVRGDGAWYQARIQPYRTLEDHIAGLVLTFVDITDRVTANEALREQVGELERFNKLVVGRELRMIELKREINELCGRVNEPPRYNEDLEGASSGETPI